MRRALIKAGFVHAKTVGFNDQCLVEACKDFGYPAVTSSIVKRGPIEVVDYAMDFWLKQMRDELAGQELSTQKIRDRVHTGVKTRLSLELPYKKVWPQAMALGAHPKNLPNTLQQIQAISDEIWYQAGDKAVDFSWYTKRAVVSQIYVATELYMLQDTSAEHQETWDFLDRRIDNVLAVGRFINQNSNFAGATQTGLQSIFQILKPEKFDDQEMRKYQEELNRKDKDEEKDSKQ